MGAEIKSVRICIFLCAVAVIALGDLGSKGMGKEEGIVFFSGALTLGGGILITGLFSLKMQWHGIIGAGVLALLGLGRGILNLPDFAKFFAGEQPRGTAPLFEACVTLVCAFLLVMVYRAWSAERIRRTIASDSSS